MRATSIPVRLQPASIRSKRLLALARDDALVEQIRRGNEAAFEVAFERHGRGLLGFCRHMLGSLEEAEDAVQQTFVAAFRDLQRRQDREVALKPWLYAIARNRCTSMLRARRGQFAEPVEPPAQSDLAQEVELRAELRELLDDLRELPEDQRAALLLSEVGDLSHADVAGVLDCEVHRVKALVFRARSGLIQRREARETPCAQIREQLANLRGGSLRRSQLRHHLRECPGCRAYREQVKQQRRMLAAALPVPPSLALKSSVLAAIGIGGSSAGGGVAAGLGGIGAALSAPLGAGALAKVAAVGVLAAGGAVAGRAALDQSAAGRAPGGSAPAGTIAPADGQAGATRPLSAPGGPRARERQAASGGDEKRTARGKQRPTGARGDEKRASRAEQRRAGARGDEKRAARGEQRRNGERGHEKRAAHAEQRPGTRAGSRGRNRLKAAPPGQARAHGRPESGAGKGAVRAKPSSPERGPAGAPPSDPPAKRGPPQTMPKAERQPKAKPEPPVAIPAPSPQPGPATNGPKH